LISQSRGLGDVYKRQLWPKSLPLASAACALPFAFHCAPMSFFLELLAQSGAN
jgi:hypothetical protein